MAGHSGEPLSGTVELMVLRVLSLDRDPAAFAGMATLLFVVGLAAACIAARRAGRVRPEGGVEGGVNARALNQKWRQGSLGGCANARPAPRRGYRNVLFP